MSGQQGTNPDKHEDAASAADERRLDSWKEIAAFLGRTERTARRWEASHGLPVRRVPSSGRGSVFAYEHELRSWLDGAAPDGPASVESSEKTASDRRPRLVMLAASLAVLAAAAIVFVLWQGAAAPDLGTKDPVAAELYRSGQHEWQTRTPSGLGRAIKDFQAAVARDRGFAKAYLGLANAYILAREFGAMPEDAAYSQARKAVAQALKLDPRLSGAHSALAFLDFYGSRDVAGAKREFAAAIALDPRDPIARHWNATFLMTIGEFRNAGEEISAAESLDSESTAIVADKALILLYEGHAREATRVLQQIESDQPSFASAHGYLAYIDLNEGDDAGYLRELGQFAASRKDARMTALAARGAEGLARDGHRGMIESLLDARLALFAKGEGSAYEIAQLYAHLGDAADALRYLHIAAARAEPEMIALKIDLNFKTLRDRPDFQQLASSWIRT